MQDVPQAIVQSQPTVNIRFASYIKNNRYQLPDGFVYLDEAAPGILYDAKYASSDNFTGDPVDGYSANRIAISIEAAEGLIKAASIAAGQDLNLLVYDAARPQRAVDRFVAWSKEAEDGSTKDKHYPHLNKKALFGEYIATRSGHSRGGAVDLTLADKNGAPLDMGGIFDLLDPRSHHGARGLTGAQEDNRALLRRIMEQAGFRAYESEWWHYSLENEPYPKKYFDFEIGPAGVLIEMPDEDPGKAAPASEPPR